MTTHNKSDVIKELEKQLGRYDTLTKESRELDRMMVEIGVDTSESTASKPNTAVPPAPTIRDVTRELAHSINPLISQTGASDTASQCAMATRMLGLLVSDDSGGIDMLGFHFLMETISCALEYEVECSLIGKSRHEV